MMPRPLQALPPAGSQIGLQRGIVTQLVDSNRVTLEPQSGGSLVCDLLETGFGILNLEVGDRVVFSPYADGLGGCVLGRLNAPPLPGEQPVPRRIRLAVDEFIVEARTRVELGTKRAQLQIHEDGRLRLTADKLLAKARRVQRFLAPMLRLN